MKNQILLALIIIFLSTCSKDQKSVNLLEGEWLATAHFVVKDGEVVFDEEDYSVVLVATFGDCQLNREKGCETSWEVTSPGNTYYTYDYTVSDDGKVLEMTSWSPYTYANRTYEILELDRHNMKLRSGDSENYYTYTFAKQ